MDGSKVIFPFCSLAIRVTGEDFDPFSVASLVIVDLDDDGHRALTAAL